MRRTRVLAAGLLLAAAGAAAAGVPRGRIEETRHNLSVTGPGDVRSTEEDRVCVFCHLSHEPADRATPGARPAAPLWGGPEPGTTPYRPYESRRVQGRQPDGASRLCLSCHDGTVAVGTTRGELLPRSLRGPGAAAMLRVPGAVPSTPLQDLRGTHPVSIDYAAQVRQEAGRGSRSRLRAEPTSPDRRPMLDPRGEVQCTSCHDPHSDPAASGLDVPPFWRADTFDGVCTACHIASLADPGHGDSARLPAGCGSCHVGHGEPGQPLLPEGEEAFCYRCHGSEEARREEREAGRLGATARPADVEELFERPYHHPVEETYGEHDPDEDLLAEGAGARRHVECADCHETHGGGIPGRRGGWTAPGTRATLTARGVPEYEVCYECHSSNANLPYGQTDKSEDFDPSNASYHPVEAPARSSSPSLLPPWLHGDLMTCSDCHGPDGDDERRGPHGSRNPWILRGFYVASDGAAESRRIYEACYRCHSRERVLSDDTFPAHSLHVLEAQVSCYSCHDAHGSERWPGLVRFDLDSRYGSVEPATRLPAGWRQPNPGYDPDTGTCTLSCHGVEHVGAGGR